MKQLWFTTGLLLAEFGDREALLRAMGSKLRDGPDTFSLVLLLTGVVLLIAVVYIAARRFGVEGGGQVERPRDLLADALRILSLDADEQSDLRYVADRSHMREPLAMLLSPRLFATAVTTVLGTSPDRERYTRLAALCRKLFDSDMPDETNHAGD